MGETEGTTQQTHQAAPEGEREQVWVVQWIFPADSSVHVLSGAKVGLGRGEECEIRLEGDRVSRRHAELYRQGPIWVLRDCGSTNGTFLDGVLVGHEAVHPGAVIRIGGNVGVVRLVRAAKRLEWSEVTPGFWLGDAALAALGEAFHVATAKLPIAIAGETGTGKERVARAIHTLSGRGGEFVGINCAAISERIAESELFGHVKGSFSGATASHPGHLRASSGGTLFLDEVSELPLAAQAKLLRAIQEQEVTPVGASRPISVDLRIIVAAQKALASYVQQGLFREDLMMRLNGLVVRVPTLRERREDIIRLFVEFMKHEAGDRAVPAFHAKFVERLCVFGWPGNVRELELLARRLFALHGKTKKMLSLEDLPKDMAPSARVEPRVSDANRKDYDVDRLTKAMRDCDGNLTAAARQIGLSRMRAYRLLNELRPEVLASETRRSREVARRDRTDQRE